MTRSALSLICVSFLLGGTKTFATEQRWSEDPADTLRLTGGLSQPGLDFSVSGPGTHLTFVPNTTGLPMLGAAYGRYGFSVQIPTDPDVASVREKGRTNLEDYQFRFFGHRDTHEFIYQHFHGYSLDGWITPQGQPVLRPDLRVTTLSYNFITALSPAYFSSSVAFAQSGVQVRGGGTALLWASVGRTQISDKETLQPTFSGSERSRLADVSEVSTDYAMAGLGYAYLQPVFRRFYGALAASTGGGFGYQRVSDLSGPEVRPTSLYRVGVRLGLGYNYGAHAAGLQLIVDSNTTRVADGQITQSTFNSRLYYTYRIPDVRIPLLSER